MSRTLLSLALSCVVTVQAAGAAPTAGVLPLVDRPVPASVLASPAAEPGSAALDPDAERIRRTYGSRFNCELAKERFVGIASVVGLVGGGLGGVALIDRKRSDGSSSSMAGYGYLIGSVAGGLLGWGVGVWLAPPCRRLDWGPNELEAYNAYRGDLQRWAACERSRSWKVGLWGGGGMLIGALAGGLIGTSGSDSEMDVWGSLLGIALGSAVGGTIGYLIGNGVVEKCKKPIGEDYWPVRRGDATSVRDSRDQKGSPIPGPSSPALE